MEDSNSPKEEREVEDDEPDYDPCNPLRKKSRGRSQRTLHERSPTVPETLNYGGSFLFCINSCYLIHAGYCTVAKGY